MNRLQLKQATQVCRTGGVIAYPTEAVYGLGCLPYYQHSVFKILTLKKRSVKKGLILVASDISQLGSYVDFESLPDIRSVTTTWPGPITWLIPALPATPAWLTGDHTTLAVRVSAHPVIRTLCSGLGPIVSTSANPQACIPARSSMRVRAYFGNSLDYVISGTIAKMANPTEIRDALTGDVIRAS